MYPQLKFTTMDHLLPKQKGDCVRMFVKHHKPKLSQLSKDDEALYRAFYHAFIDDRVYVALLNDTPMALTCLSDNQHCAFETALDEFQSFFGGFRGSMGQLFFARLFESNTELPDNTCSLDFITCKNSNESIQATKSLINHLVDTLAYETIMLVTFAGSQADKIGHMLNFKLVDKKESPIVQWALGISQINYMEKHRAELA